MKTNKNSFQDLSDLEMGKINGGESVFFKLGQASHKAWCQIEDAWIDYCSNPHSAYGSYAGMNN
jgi:hypothetical protein